jgi:arylsulfatase A-like enzyme
MVWKLDESVGRVMQALEEKGILGHTIVAFVSDNGASTIGIHRNHGSNWPLRGVRTPTATLMSVFAYTLHGAQSLLRIS